MNSEIKSVVIKTLIKKLENHQEYLIGIDRCGNGLPTVKLKVPAKDTYSEKLPSSQEITF